MVLTTRRDSPSSPRISRRIHEVRSCSTPRTAPCSAKRKSVSQARAPSRRTKRTRCDLHDPATPCVSLSQISVQRRGPEVILGDVDLLLCCSSLIPIWGAKRPRGALTSFPRLGPSQILTWGAKRARSALLSAQLLPVPPDWRDWTNLGDGPAGLIAERLLADDVADYVCFRAVCRPWRLCSTDPCEHGILDRRFHPRQWIMLREKRATPHRRRFMNVSAGHCRDVHLPELNGHEVYGPTTEGLLVLLDRVTYVVRVLNPFTRQVAAFPPANTLLTQSDLFQAKICKHLWQFLQLSGAGLAADDSIAVCFKGIQTVVVGKPGDLQWTVVDCSRCFLQAMSFAGRFYCAMNGAVMVVETSAGHPPRMTVAAKLTRPLSRMMMDTLHLVEIAGELVFVDHERYGNVSSEFRVHRVDLDAGKIVPVHGFGGHTVFLGIQLALSVSPSVFPSVNADAIYLGFDDSLPYRLGDGPIQIMDGTSEPRLFEDSSSELDDSIHDSPLYGPLGVDHYLSWCVTDYRDNSTDT